MIFMFSASKTPIKPLVLLMFSQLSETNEFSSFSWFPCKILQKYRVSVKYFMEKWKFIIFTWFPYLPAPPNRYFHVFPENEENSLNFRKFHENGGKSLNYDEFHSFFTQGHNVALANGLIGVLGVRWVKKPEISWIPPIFMKFHIVWWVSPKWAEIAIFGDFRGSRLRAAPAARRRRPPRGDGAAPSPLTGPPRCTGAAPL